MERKSRIQQSDHQQQQEDLFFRSRDKDLQKRKQIRQTIIANITNNHPHIQQYHQNNLPTLTKKTQTPPKQQQQQIDIFGDNAIDHNKLQQQNNGSLDTDEVGYYNVVVGKLINNGLYKIIQKLGKGVFGVVVKVEHTNQQTLTKHLAIKILRKNPVTEKSGQRQFNTLHRLGLQKTSYESHIVKAFDSFYESGHLCLVFELMGEDLRTYLHKNQNKITLSLIRQYSIHMFLALHHLKKNKVIHADIKPDNFLTMLNDPTQIKLADFGSAYRIEQHVVSDQLVARYYRAPQLALCTQYERDYLYAIDVWAIGCTLYQLYTGNFLFNASSNNQLLKQMMETCGKFSIKMLNKSANMLSNFDTNYNFIYRYIDKNTKHQKTQKMQITVTSDRQLLNLIKKNKKELTVDMGKDQIKRLHQFKDLLQKCLVLNPKDRITPAQALMHPFISYQVKLQ